MAVRADTVRAGTTPARDLARGSAGASSVVHVFEPRQSGLANSLREAWRYRRFGVIFGNRFLEKRFGRTWLGMIWVPLRPAINLVTRITIYGGLIGIVMGRIPYSLAFLVGTAAWQLFYEGIFWSSSSILFNRATVKDIYMPRSVLAISGVTPSVIDFIVNISFVVIGLIYYFARAHVLYLHIGYRTLLAPIGLVLMLLMGLGVGLALVGAGARTRDLRFSLPFFLNFVYFLTPVIYPITEFPPRYRPFVELNPATGAVDMVKDGFFGTHTLTMSSAAVTLIAVLLIWGPVHWYADRREIRLINGAKARARAAD